MTFRKNNTWIGIGVITLLLIALLLPHLAFSRLGVGVGLSRINIDEPMRAGGIYTLPSLPVLNTGDETSSYSVSIQYHEGQETREDMGLRPEEDWFRFSPKVFNLEPSQNQRVGVTLIIPTKVQPGKYFAYLEARPVQQSEDGITSVGIAAATKLTFDIAPANLLQGIYYRSISLYDKYHPWNTIVLAVIFILLIIRSARKRFSFEIVKKK